MTTRRMSWAIGVLATAGVAFGAGSWWPSRAASAPAAEVTPKTQTPNEARALSHAFAQVAKALSPSVVRIDIEMEQPRVATEPDEAKRSDRAVDVTDLEV